MTDGRRASVEEQQQQAFECSECHRRFARLDHLNRHFRTHTQERPYVCTLCRKAFARVDLLKRHTSQHLVSSSQRRNIANTSETGQRVSQACRTCALSKLKCSNRKPCNRCVRKNIPCNCEQAAGEPQDVESTESGDGDHTTGMNAIAEDTADQIPTIHTQDAHLLSPPSDRALSHPFGEPSFSCTSAPSASAPMVLSASNTTERTGSMRGDVRMVDSIDLSSYQADPEMDIAAQSYSDILKDILGHSAESSTVPQTIVMDETVNSIWNQYLSSEQDFDNFDNFSFSPLVEPFPGFPLPETCPGRDESISSFEEAAISAGSQAFQASGWNWGPTSQDRNTAEHPDLILLPDKGRMKNSNDQSRDLVFSLLAPGDRHRILSLLLQHCEKENWVRIASTFPSESFLDNLLQAFFAFQAADTLSWFHVPSFRLDNIQDELLVAVVANGACLTPNDSVQKFGYVIPEILRYAVIDRWSKDNSTSRDLQLLQTCSLVAVLSTWSGDKRKMEIGEGNVQPLITIMRRARWLRSDHYGYICPNSDDEGLDLHRKWQEWVDLESKKRLIYRAFVFDAQLSMMNNVNPLMSYSEMRVPFPESIELWRASSAEDWKHQYFKQSHIKSQPRLSLAEAIRVVFSEGDRQQAEFDPASTLYVLYGLWGLVWEHQQLQETFNLGDLHEAPNCVLPSRREMLIKVLKPLRNTWSFSAESRSPESVESTLILEYLYMALHAPLQGLQAFAGRDGEREARRIYPVLQEWTQTREARQALWHAGQVYRAAEAHSSRRMRDLSMKLVYQASVTFWVYGIIISAPRRTAISNKQLPPQRNGALEGLVWLDGESSAAARRFIAISEGVPVLRDYACGYPSQLVPKEKMPFIMVEDASATMALAVGLLRRPLPIGEGAQVLLVNIITRLMAEIGKVSKFLQSM